MNVESPLVIEADALDELIDTLDLRGALTAMFRALADGAAVQPAQTVGLFPGGEGDVITYLGVLAPQRVFGAKLSPYIPRPDGAIVTAWTMLMSMETGRPLLLCDAARLTTERTAATTALAVDHLAPDDAAILTVVGAGSVGLAHLRHAATLRPWREIRLVARSQKGQDAAPQQTRDGTVITRYHDADAAAEGADVVLLCTSAASPVIDVKRLGNACVVTSISTNAPQAHEIDPRQLGGLDVYCDDRHTDVAADMRSATAQGFWSVDRLLGDLPELVAGRATLPSRARPAYFRSVGLGLEDIAAAAAVLAALQQ
jgi:L-arginine dehydrogenase